MTLDTIETKEQAVEIENNSLIEYGGFWRRFGANFLDGVLFSLTLGFIIAFIFTGNPFTMSTVEEPMQTHEIITNILFTLYGLLLPIFWYGYTVGKKLMNVQIQRVDGKKITFWTMFMRTFIAGFVYGITLGIAGIVSVCMLIFREDKRSLHDLMAGTIVVKTESEKTP